MTKRPEIKKDLGLNPFLETFTIPVTQAESETDFILVDDIMLPSKYLMETMQRTELYYTDGVRKRIAGLSDKAQRLLWDIVFSLDRGKDYFQFNTEYYMLSQKIKSRTTVVNAMSELKRYCFVANTPQSCVYWINPSVFFSGSRLNFYKKTQDSKKVLNITKWEK